MVATVARGGYPGRAVTRVAFLVVVDGDHRSRVDLAADEITIGRSEDCDVVLAGDETVSRRHAALHRTPQGWTAVDLSSRNGTYVNGRRIDPSALLGSDDRLRVGGYVLVLRTDEMEDRETTDGTSASSRRAGADTPLSRREIDVVRLVCAGLSDQAIAAELFVSVKTVHSHLDRIGAKTGHRRRAELVRFALDHGLA